MKPESQIVLRLSLSGTRSSSWYKEYSSQYERLSKLDGPKIISEFPFATRQTLLFSVSITSANLFVTSTFQQRSGRS